MKNILKKIITYIITLQAKYILQKFNPFIIAITGNLGKTSTKDSIYAALKNNLTDIDGEILINASKKSLNSEIGVPLTILDLESGYTNFFLWIKIILAGFNKCFAENYFKYLILEIGADAPNDIKNVCKYIKPDIVVLTAFAEVPVHVENFNNDRERLIREKKYLVEALKDGGVFIYNLDDKDSVKIADEVKARGDVSLKSFSIKDPKANIFANEIDFLYEDDKLSGMKSKVFLDKKEFDLKIKDSLGESLILSSLPAILISESFQNDFDLEKVLKDLENAKKPNGRMRILEGVDNSIIIDDTYNASPKAVEHGIETVAKIKNKNKIKKIFVLGDMLELGLYTRDEHYRIGKLASEACDILITSGIRAKIFAEGALDAGMKDENIFMCDNSTLAGKQLIQILEELKENKFKSGLSEKDLESKDSKSNFRDIIYVKGSQGVRMERVVKMILAENYDSNLDLVRQDNFWKNK